MAKCRYTGSDGSNSTSNWTDIGGGQLLQMLTGIPILKSELPLADEIDIDIAGTKSSNI